MKWVLGTYFINENRFRKRKQFPKLEPFLNGIFFLGLDVMNFLPLARFRFLRTLFKIRLNNVRLLLLLLLSKYFGLCSSHKRRAAS